MDFRDSIEEIKNELEAQITSTKNAINLLPQMILVVRHEKDRKKSKWYSYTLSSDISNPSKHPKYLRKGEYDLARKLVRRKYLVLALGSLEYQLSILNNLLCQYDTRYDEKLLAFQQSENYLEFMGEAKYQIKNSDEIINMRDQWLKDEYFRNPYKTEELDIEVNDSHVRSKAEADIIKELGKYGIPFRYECLYNLRDGHNAYPDFTIWLPDGNLLYWEHLGRMDESEYRIDNMKKLSDYQDSGLVFCDNLIVTFESKKHKLQFPEIDFVIEKKILPRLKGYTL